MARRGLIGCVLALAAGCVEATNVVECNDENRCPQGLICSAGTCVVDGGGQGGGGQGGDGGGQGGDGGGHGGDGQGGGGQGGGGGGQGGGSGCPIACTDGLRCVEGACLPDWEGPACAAVASNGEGQCPSWTYDAAAQRCVEIGRCPPTVGAYESFGDCWETCRRASPWSSSYPATGLQARWAVAADLDGDGADELAIADAADAGAGLWILRPLRVGEVPQEGGAGWPATRIGLGAVPWLLTSTPGDHLGGLFAGDLVTVSTLDDPAGARTTGAAVVGLRNGGAGAPTLLAQSFSLGTVTLSAGGEGLDDPFFALATLGASGPPQLVAGNLSYFDHRSFDPLGGDLGTPTPLAPGASFAVAIQPLSTGAGRFVIGAQAEVRLFEASLQSFPGRTALLPDGGERWWSWARVEAGEQDWAFALAAHDVDAHVSATLVPPSLTGPAVAPIVPFPDPAPIANVTRLVGPTFGALWGVSGARDDLAFVTTTGAGQELHVMLDLLPDAAAPRFAGEQLTAPILGPPAPVVAIVAGRFREAGGDQLELVRADGSLTCVAVSEAPPGGTRRLTACLP